MIDRGGNRVAISIDKPFSWREFFFQWEWMLVGVLFLVIVVNALISPYFLSVNTFLRTPATFLDKGFIVLPMMFVMILGRI
ncbi:MAG: ABC transporter permease, partial [Spirochaetota bacterium]